VTPSVRTVAVTAGAALMLTGLIGACSRTIEGTATRAGSPDATAETRIPMPTTRSSTPRSTPRTTTPGGPTSSRTPSASPPGDPLTTTCEQYTDMSAADKNAVIEAILAEEGSVLGPENTDIAKGLTDAACQFLPKVTVAEILLGTPPR
jgi:hypothetical protein